MNKSWKSFEKNMNKLWTSPEQLTNFLLNKSWKNWEKLWASCKQVTNKSWTSNEQVMKKSWTSHEQVVTKLWTSREQAVNKLWTIQEQVLNKLWTSHEQVMRSLSNLSNSKLLSWVGGWWFQSVMRLRLSQPSLAGVEAWAELGKNTPLSPQSTISNRMAIVFFLNLQIL